jgi:hypothetical protein
MELKQITSFSTNFNDIPEVGAIRNFVINGDDQAAFMLIIASSSGKFYDFTEKTFSLGHGPSKVLKSKIQGQSYNGSILFPNQAGENYDIILMANPSDNTVISGQVINKRIVQLGNVTLTISLDPQQNTNSYDTLPSNVTSTNNPSITGAVRVPIDFTIANAQTDANAFGLITKGDRPTMDLIVNDKPFYFETTSTVDGNVSSSTTIVLSDVDDIQAGMIISSGTGISGTPLITNVDVPTKTITVKTAQTISNGVTLTMQAIGLSAINSVLNCNVSSNLRFRPLTPVTSTVRGSVSNSTTITLNGTYGIPGGDIAIYNGTNVNNSSTNTVTINRTSVGNNVASASEGEIVVTLAQTFNGGELLRFSHVNAATQGVELLSSFHVFGEVIISKYPSSNRTIKYNLDALVDPGTAT